MDERPFSRHWPKAAAFLIALLVAIAYALIAPPRAFPTGTIVTVSRGESIAEVADMLAGAHVVAHPLVLRAALQFGFGGKMQAGPYLMNGPESALHLAYRLSSADFGIPPTRVTFPEGFTVRDMAEKIADAIPQIAAASFIASGTPMEGFLFPDTYLFGPDATVASVQKAMRENFDTKTAALAADIAASGRSLRDIVILASLVEKEARTTENRKLVAGVLLNRLSRGMPLQVDAVFGYIYGRDTYSPSLDDLKVNSPYNTYTHAGLPPGPIDNPGLHSLRAAIAPTKSDYLYYLTDKNGVMHYATTYQQHLANIAKYPR